MKRFDVKEKIKAFLVDLGDPVLAETNYCTQRVQAGEEGKANVCVNCEGLEGCRKLAELGLLLNFVRQHGEDTDEFKEFYREMVKEILRGNGFLKNADEFFEGDENGTR